MSSCDKLTTRKVVRFLKGRGGNGQAWWDLGSVIIDCGDKHYNKVGGKGIPECYLKAWPVTPLVA